MATVRDERGEASRDRVRFLYWQFRHRPKISSPVRQRTCDMEVQVRDGLVSGNAVVLPDGNTGSSVSTVNGEACISHGDHHLFRNLVGQMQQRRDVRHRKDQEMRDAALFSGNQRGNVILPPKHRVRAPADEVVAERAPASAGKLNGWFVGVAHDGFNEFRNAWISR